MRKVLLWMPLAAMALASCSNSEDAANIQTALQNAEVRVFPQIQGSTRGTLSTTASLNQFNLIARGLFATSSDQAAATLTNAEYQKVLVKTDGVWAFSDASKLYWGDSSTPAYFTAYANKGETAAYAEGKISGFAVDKTDPSKHKDLIVAFNSGNKTDFASGVPLHFRHAVTQVLVNANYNYTATTNYPDVTVKVKGVKIVNIDDQGTLTLPTTSTVESYTPAWALSGNSVEMQSDYTTPVVLGSTNALIDNSSVNGPMLLLPQTKAAAADLKAATITGAYLCVQVDIDYKEAQGAAGSKYIDLYPRRPDGQTGDQAAGTGDYAWVAVPLNIDWKAGYKYTYTLNFTNTAFGKVAPGTDDGDLPLDPDDPTNPVDPGEPVVPEVYSPVSFLVTVEEAWTEVNTPTSLD